MLNGLDIFSGIGGMSLGLREWVKPIGYCEIDPYCQAVLLSRMANRLLPKAPIWDDVSTLPPRNFGACVDIIIGGFPCQDISIAGNGKGLDGERSGLFFEIIRLAKEMQPSFLFLENVPAIRSRGGIEVLRSIAELGYDSRFCIISAKSIGARHQRDRFFLLAHSNSTRNIRLPSGKTKTFSKPQLHPQYEKWNIGFENESDLLGKNDGIPCQMDRIRALGNAVVAQQAKEAFKILMGMKNVND